MTRSIWKGPFIDSYIVKLARKKTQKPLGTTADQGTQLQKTSILHRIWSRRSCILPQFVDSSVQVYNGKKWISLRITGEMVGHKFGEFASTRTLGALKDKRTNGKVKTKLKAKAR